METLRHRLHQNSECWSSKYEHTTPTTTQFTRFAVMDQRAEPSTVWPNLHSHSPLPNSTLLFLGQCACVQAASQPAALTDAPVTQLGVLQPPPRFALQLESRQPEASTHTALQGLTETPCMA